MKINYKEINYLSKISNSFYDDFKIDFLYNSNKIEGSTFSKDNLDKLLHYKKVEGSHFYDDVIETRNSLDVFDKVIQDSDKDLNKFDLFDWHRTLKRGSVDEELNNSGCYKKFENRLSGIDIKLALPGEVESLMFNLISDYNEIHSPTIEDIARFHYKFEMIHPFQDGNGRIGRFIILKQCLKDNIDLIAIDDEYEDEYRKALYLAQKSDNISKLVDVFYKCQVRLDEKLSSYNDLLIQIKSEIS